MTTRQKFTAEFKREAVRSLQLGNKPAAVVARELGIPRNRIYKWAQEAGTKGHEAFRGSGRPKASADELSVLQRENARLQEENEILKKPRCTLLGNCHEVRLDRPADGLHSGRNRGQTTVF